MNKLFTKIAGLSLGLAMAIGVGVAVGSKEATPVEATTSDGSAATSITSGKKYLVTAVYSNTRYYLTPGDSALGTGAVVATSISNVTSATEAMCWTFTGSGTSWTIAANGFYLANTNTNNGVKTQASSQTWTSAYSNGNFTLTGGSSRKLALYQGSNWRCYSTTSGVQSLQLYEYAAAKTVSSIAVKTAPTKTTYYANEYFNPTGLVITATYSDSTTADISYADHSSDFTFSPTTSTALTTSNTSVTITYATKTASQAITVNAARTLSSISISGYTTTFDQGDAFAFGGTVTANYSNSTTENVTASATFSGYDMSSYGSQTVTVSYTEGGVTKTATYGITVNRISTITFTGGTETGTSSGQNADSLTKGGITIDFTSAYTSSGAYRIYSGSTTTISSSVGNMAKIEFNMNGSYNSNLLSTETGSYDHSSSSKGVWTGDANSVEFSASAQARVDSIVITLASTDPLVELAASSATSVSILKGDSDTSVKVLVKNIDSLTWDFTFDEDEEKGLTTSSYISVSASALVSNVSTLTITTKAVGATTMHISVSGTACEDTVPVTVAAKPQSGTMVAKLNSVVVSSAVEVQTGLYKQFTFAAEDTDGNAYSITADDVTGAKQSGTADVTISGTRVTGDTTGTAVVRYSLKVLSSVYVDITLNVVDDYKTTVKTITVINNAVVDQGDTLEVSDHISVKKANTHFGSEMDIADNELLFSYTNSRAAGVVASSFVFDVTDDTLDAGDTETRTIYVFATFDESYAGTSFTAVITVEDRPVTGLYVNGSEATDEQEFNINVTRYQTYQLDVSVKPSNATESHQIDYAVFMADEGSGVTVNSSGLISVSGVLGQHATISAASHANSDHVVYFNVTVVRETVTITYDQPEVWTVVSDNSTLQAGDQVILTGVKSDVTYAAGLYAGGNNVPADTENTLTVSGDNVTGVVSSMVYTLETGSVSGSLAFKDSQDRYLAAASSGSNYLKTSDTINGESSFILNSDGTVVAQGTYTRNYMRYNNTSTSNLFACYASTGTTGNLVTFYKKSGGEATVTATSGLLDVLDAAMTYDDGTYTLNLCDASGSTFNSSAWTSLGNNFTSSIKSSNQLAYARSSETGNEVEQFLACYDYVVGKYGESYDFLGRIASGKIAASSRIAPLSIINGNGNTVAIIVIISMISVTAIGGYFFLRKRKEQ